MSTSPNSQKGPLLLIDGHALLYRSFHALPPLSTKDGTPTNAVYGFITTLLKAYDDIKPHYVAVCFDVDGDTHRRKEFEGYKASRKPMPDDLRKQIPLAYTIVEAMNIPIFAKQGFEADDLIGTLTKLAAKQKVKTVIATGDRDAFQLVDDFTSVYTMGRFIAETKTYHADDVKTKMGVRPNQITDYKALAGDSSDEIPGIPGIGDKTAVTLLSHYDSIDDLFTDIKNGDGVKGVSANLAAKIKAGEASSRMSKKLATIDRDVDIELDLGKCVVHDYDPNKVATEFQKLEFYSLIKRLPDVKMEELETQKQERDWTYDVVKTEDDFVNLITKVEKAKNLVIDTETDDLYGPVVGISVAMDSKHGWYIPTVKEHGMELSFDKIADLLRPVLENSKIGKIGHNIKYDLTILEQLGITLAPVVFDTMIAAYVLGAHLRSFDFDSCAARELNYMPIPLDSIVKKPIKKGAILEADATKLAEYAAEDAVITFRLFEHLSKELEKEPTLKKVAETMDFPLIPVLRAMERRGILVDKKILAAIKVKLAGAIQKLEKQIKGYSQDEININSPAQLQKLLFKDLGLAKGGIKTTQTGLSTAASELEKLQGSHPIIDDIMLYREYTKLLGTYVEKLPKQIKDDSRVHTVYSQIAAATGRLSSDSPNLQNIPIRSQIGNDIRKAFVAPDGYDFISIDYSQFELRIIAHLSGDKELQQVFLDGRDIHDEVSKKLGIDRRGAKAINFGIVYGLSAFGLAQAIKIDPKIAKEYIDAYFATYPKLAQYLKNTKDEVKKNGYVETIYGRRRPLPEIHAANAIVRAAAERQAINAPAQGTEADITKLAMIEIEKWLEKEYGTKEYRPYLLLQIHDSFLLECPKSEIQKVADHVKKIMESITKIAVPLTVDISVGPNWGELNKIK